MTAAAIRRLIDERRWLEKAYDLAEIEAAEHRSAGRWGDARAAQRHAEKLAEEVVEIGDALEILNGVSARTVRRVTGRTVSG